MRSIRCSFLISLMFGWCVSIAFPQSQTTGNITGRAQDSSGALIPASTLPLQVLR